MSFGQGIEKSSIVSFVDKRRLSCPTPVHYVIDGVGILNSERSRHVVGYYLIRLQLCNSRLDPCVLQHKQSEAGALQGDLSRSGQERSNRCAQGLGAVSAKRSSAVSQGGFAGSERETGAERSSQAVTRRRRRLVNERVRVVNNLQADLQAVCPGLLEITEDAGNQWFLNFLVSADTLPQLARLRRSTVLKIPAVGVKCANQIQGWQRRAHFSAEVEYVGEMIQEDARRILELRENIKRLEAKIAEVAKNSTIARILRSIPGYGAISTAELACEIGTIERFGSEGSLALYLGMATLDNSSGKYQGTKPPKHVNTRAKAAMMTAVDRHRKYVPESQRYYEKKRTQGKGHNQAIRALGRHLCKIIYKMLKEEREYHIRPLTGNTKTKVRSRSCVKTKIRRPKLNEPLK
jgi:transposase